MPRSDAAALATTLTPARTMEALASGVVARWWQTTVYLRVAGPDAVSLLDGLCTQAVERIEPRTALLGLFLDAKARIIAPTILHRVPDAPWTDPRGGTVHETSPELYLETPATLLEPLRSHLVRYRLRSKVTIEEGEVSGIALAGPTARAAAEAIELDPVDGAWTVVSGHARPTVAFVGSAQACGRLVRELLPAAGVGLADPDAFEADRILHRCAGLHDLLPGRMPAEVGGMDSAVALDAGCYLGQEPVARLHYRGRANRTLRLLEATSAVQVPATGEAGAGATDAGEWLDLLVPDAASDARSPGRLTTWATHPSGGTVALAMLRREIAAGDPLVLRDGDVALRCTDDAPA